MEEYAFFDTVSRRDNCFLTDDVVADGVAVAVLHKLFQFLIVFHVEFVAEVYHSCHEESRIINVWKVVLELDEGNVRPELQALVPHPQLEVVATTLLNPGILLRVVQLRDPGVDRSLQMQRLEHHVH